MQRATQSRFCRALRLESLERRLTLSGVFNPPPPPAGVQPLYVAPPAALAPIELPPLDSLPAGTTQLSPPAPGALLPGMSPMGGGAEALAVNAVIGFQAAHPAAAISVTDAYNATAGSFSLTVTGQDGLNFFRYTVTETASQVQVGLVQHDTTSNTVVGGIEWPAQQTGGIVFVQFNQGSLASVLLVGEFMGVVTTYQYPTPAAQANVQTSLAAQPTAQSPLTAQPSVQTPLTAQPQGLAAASQSHADDTLRPLTGPSQDDLAAPYDQPPGTGLGTQLGAQL